MMERKVLRTVEHKIKPFKHIRIGDPMYFEELENGSKNAALKELTCDFKTRCCNVGAIIITETEYEYSKGHTFKNFEVKVFLGKNEGQINVYKEGKWFGEKSLSKRYELGCDTACFEIIVDGRYYEFHTGADGYYGTMDKFKQGFGLFLSLDFDGDLFSLEDIEQHMSYLFGYKD